MILTCHCNFNISIYQIKCLEFIKDDEFPSNFLTTYNKNVTSYFLIRMIISGQDTLKIRLLFNIIEIIDFLFDINTYLQKKRKQDPILKKIS